MTTDLESIIKDVDSLPTLPAVAVEVLEVLASEDADVGALSDVIERDPALVGKLLRVANSAMFGFSREISSIRQAIMILGLRTVKIMVLSFSLVDTWSEEDPKGFDYRRYWRRTLIKGVAARAFAYHLGLSQRDEAFIIGLLADIGILVLHERLRNDYLTVLEAYDKDGGELHEHEAAILGVDHMEVAGLLLETWGLPSIIANPVRAQYGTHDVEDDCEDVRVLTKLLDLANISSELMAEDHEEKEAADIAAELANRSESHFEIERAAMQPILEAIREHVEETVEFFAIDIGGDRAMEGIRQRAQQALVDLSLKTAQENNELLDQNKELKRKATIDALTQVANRGELDDRLNEEFKRAKRMRSPLGFLLMDIDHFKRINDGYGHDMGDGVLRGVALVLRKSIREIDLVARYGGEEFGVICPGISEAGLSQLAERIRRTVAAMKIPLRDRKQLRVTLSVGGVLMVDAKDIDAPSVLTTAADRLLYQAKESGRNCIRISKIEEVSR